MAEDETITNDDGTTQDPGNGSDPKASNPTAGGDPADPPPGAGGEGQQPVKADWPENWRELMSGGDEKVMKRLARYKSPIDVEAARRAAEQRLSSGELKAKLPDDATEEQIAEYRKENGIPDTHDGYLEKLPDGLVIGDDDKPIVDGFLKAAHGQNADPAFVSSALNWYYEQQEEQQAAQAEADKEFKQKAEDALRAKWGNEYRSNINSMLNFMETAPKDESGQSVKDLLLGGRLADGTKAADNPAMVEWLVQMADMANPAGFIAPGSGMSQIEGVKEEIAKIEKTMRTNRAAYNKDEAMQQRYRDLLEAHERLK